MAVYVGPDGREWVAIGADADQAFAGQLAARGDWMVSDAAGKKFVVAADYFARNYAQKYPRPVGDECPDGSPTASTGSPSTSPFCG